MTPQGSGGRTQEGAPRDETEQQIARIWQDALGIDEVGIHDNFTRLGGHSLLAIRIVAELRRAFQMTCRSRRCLTHRRSPNCPVTSRSCSSLKSKRSPTRKPGGSFRAGNVAASFV